MFFESYVRRRRYYCYILRASNGLGQLGLAKSRPPQERFRGYSIGTPVLKSLWAFQIAYIFAPFLKNPPDWKCKTRKGKSFRRTIWNWLLLRIERTSTASTSSTLAPEIPARRSCRHRDKSDHVHPVPKPLSVRAY